MKYFICVICLLCIFPGNILGDDGLFDNSVRDPYFAGFAGAVFPGAGYFYSGDIVKGALNSLLIAPMAIPFYVTTEDFLSTSIKINIASASRNLYFYSVYDSFQSIIPEKSRKNMVMDIPHYSLAEMLSVPFNPKTYEFDNAFYQFAFYAWMAAPIIEAGYRVFTKGINPDLTAQRLAVSIPLILLQTLLVGIGEESYFRGFQMPAFAQFAGSSLGGNLLQAASFGLAHTRIGAKYITTSPLGIGTIFRYTRSIDDTRQYKADATTYDGQAIPDYLYFLATGVAGYAWGVLTENSKHGLLKSIMVHMIVDAALFMGDLLTDGSTGRLYMTIRF